MGTFNYDSVLKVDFEDRVLAHIQIVIGAKLRRGESFNFSWRDDEAIGDGRTTVWVHPALPIVYKYNGGKMPRINPAWIQVLSDTANSNGGLQLVPEPDSPLSGSGGSSSGNGGTR
ncbi:DUF7882 family protein [Subtercola boreus]|uniref:ATP-dependent DNA ligase n=1 Tax=Subtercola boreus TaxID=120213 RepID=A0A3E0W6K1_9MICO|nr:ATP-dependent DNA ligase [Subtercola boreus]RFA18055.1 ATP-dependent DNA ligase [Subtercola boreus]RFA18437.1 ATP-dependent DNA ligase [Subtercola boreus]RFA24966.1 ATP-dependent DNA ligase [Subtercola boreus]